ncbi:MAG TPA: YggS family pyridoxal phosphate-dependent enzyme, partial [Bacteroidia bacterium]|nr:YggS family pyridoxal phosphate-dependent enzyme [Bacteroidia bacterium]
MSITENYLAIRKSLPDHVKLVVVSKFHPVEAIKEVYDAGQRIFGENRVQEMMEKKPLLPDDVEWHLIGTLQSNKVKYIAPFV